MPFRENHLVRGGFLIKKTKNDNIKTLMEMIAIKVFY